MAVRVTYNCGTSVMRDIVENADSWCVLATGGGGILSVEGPEMSSIHYAAGKWIKAEFVENGVVV